MQVDACMASRQAQERILAVLPMFHVYGLTTCLISGVFSASQIILLTRFDPAKTMQAIRAHSPTIFPLVPAICESLCNEIESTGGSPAPLKSVRLCLSGAAPLPKATVDRFIRVAGIEPLEGYGLTEAGPVTHANLPGVSRVGSIGVPLPDTFARIASFADPDHDAAFDEPGELLISGPQIMRGYFGDPDLNRGVLTTDESGRVWLHTGDVASVDKDGYFHIVDRQKDMIIRSGLKVYPSRVEQVLLKHPSVKEVAVFGRPDPVHTERVSAAIVLHHPTQNSQKLVSDLRDFCRQHLAAYEVPEAIEFLEAIPKSPLGKVLKRQLRDSSPEPKPSSPPRPKGVAA
jgi:long-chain acyl-CoA synthetase